MRTMDRASFDSLEHRYKVMFFNSIVGHKNVCLLGTKDFENRTNLAIFNSLLHIGSNPPLLGIIFRPDSVERHTFENILETKSYTINLITEADLAAAHQTSARYEREISEFDAAGLTAVYQDSFFAPFVSSSPVSFGMKLREHIPIALNGTHLIIGEVQLINYPVEIVEHDGFADITKAGIAGCIGLDAYTKGSVVQRYEYAKSDKPLRVKT